MKARTKVQTHRFQQVKPENLNNNIIECIDQYNGGLSSENMPNKGITVSHIETPTITQSAGTVTTAHSNGALHSYHQVKRWNMNEGGTDEWTPVESIDLVTEPWTPAWNKLQDFGTMSDLELTFESEEAMLTGCAVIDFHHGTNRIRYDAGISAFYGNHWHTEWAVFVNGVKIAETGKIYPRRHTAQIPFKVPVGSGNVTIDVRFKTITHTNGATLALYMGQLETPLDIFGVTIWAKETK